MAILFTAQPVTSTMYPIILGHSVKVNDRNIKISLSKNTTPSGYNHFEDGIVFKIHASADFEVIEMLKKNIKANLRAKGILPIGGTRDWYNVSMNGINLSSIIYEEIEKLKALGYEIEVYQPPKIIKKVIQPLA